MAAVSIFGVNIVMKKKVFNPSCLLLASMSFSLSLKHFLEGEAFYKILLSHTIQQSTLDQVGSNIICSTALIHGRDSCFCHVPKHKLHEQTELRR